MTEQWTRFTILYPSNLYYAIHPSIHLSIIYRAIRCEWEKYEQKMSELQPTTTHSYNAIQSNYQLRVSALKLLTLIVRIVYIPLLVTITILFSCLMIWLELKLHELHRLLTLCMWSSRNNKTQSQVYYKSPWLMVIWRLVGPSFVESLSTREIRELTLSLHIYTIHFVPFFLSFYQLIYLTHTCLTYQPTISA